MKLFKCLALAFPLISSISGKVIANPSSLEFDLDIDGLLIDENFDSLPKDSFDFDKRDSLSTIEDILIQVNDSNIIFDILHEIAGSDEQINNLADAIETLVKNGSTTFEGFHISLNVSNILDSVKKSGLITTTLNGILLNENNRRYTARIVGSFLRRDIWISKLLYDLGNGHALTVPFIADTIKNTKSKAPSLTKPNSTNLLVYKRDDHSGSAQQFVNNIISQALHSELVGNSLENVLVALNRTDILVPIVLKILNDTTTQGMAAKLVVNLYHKGLFNNIDLNKYYVQLKKSNKLSDGVQIALTNPTYSPALAKILQQMDEQGVYYVMQHGLHGF